MTIDTKFEIGDKVFLILDNKVVEKEITGVKLLAYQQDQYCETYVLNYEDVGYPAVRLFKSKKELLKSL
jgi:hypothetical protein